MMTLDSLNFTAIRTCGIITALWHGGTYDECCAAWKALQDHGFEPQQIEYMGLGLYSIIGLVTDTVWMQAVEE